jgi:hypothetical protein
MSSSEADLFQVGAEVKYLGPCDCGYIGAIGVITELNPEKTKCLVKFYLPNRAGRRFSSWCNKSSLEHT